MSPEFLRRYYILRIVTNPQAYELQDSYVSLKDLQHTLNRIKARNWEDVLYQKLESHSSKTIKRDLVVIESYYNITIKIKRNYGYYIIDDTTKDYKKLKEVYEQTELYLLNHHAHAWKAYVTSARTSLSDNVDIVALINAIEHNLIVELEYKGWYDDNKFQTFKGDIQALHIKEINNAWYLMAYNEAVGVIPFCLDKRISSLIITSKVAKKKVKFDEASYFKNAIGILKTKMKPEWIHLKVANHHFKYLQSNKMHPSQKVISYPKLPETESLNYDDLDIWGEIKICVEPNYEFIMQVLQYNLWVKVVSPTHVKDEIKHHIELMLNYY